MKTLSRLFVATTLACAVATPASAITHAFTTTLDGPQAGTLSPGSGTGTVSYDDSSNLLAWDISFNGLAGTETAAHFHGPADFGEDAGIQVGLPLGSPKVGSATISAAQAAELMAERWYVNIHSTVEPSGEIRGQVVLVPEPHAYALMLAGLGLIGLMVRRQVANARFAT